MKKIFVLIAVTAIYIATAEAQDSTRDLYTVSGQVLDSLANEAVPYATVGVAFAQTPTLFVSAVAADGNGKFELRLKAPGNYMMTIQAIGIATLLKPFTLTEASRKTDFGRVWVRENVQKIDEVTVAAQKPLVKVEIDKLIYSMEDDPEAKVNNTLEMLRKVPMVTVDGDENVLLKGASNFKVYLNGKESNLLNGQNMSQVLKSMPAGSVKNIEVITDPGARYDAEGIGGIINIVTTRNVFSGIQGSLQANASSYGGYGGSAYLTAKTGKLGVTGNFSYNHQSRPWGESESLNENYVNDLYHTESALGRSRNEGDFMFGHLEASYEFDTLNLLSLGVDLFNGKFGGISELQRQMLDIADHEQYSYKQGTDSENTFGQLGINLDYQRSTHRKGENFTFSYRFNQSPNDNKSITSAYDINGIIPPIYHLNQIYDSQASTTEHTAQLDYVNPLTDKHSIEAGLKYILRQNVSNVHQQVLNAVGEWEDLSNNAANSDFKHISNIYAGYAGYAYKNKSWGFRTGVRAEGTKQDVEFRLAPEQDFGSDYFNVVPSVTVSYQLKPTQQLRAGYNLRISRPSIWYLNPYINDTDPSNISYGNPDLDPEKSNSFNLSYSYFSPKLTLNISGSYTYVNNSIERHTFIDEADSDIRQSTFANIGRSQRTGMFVNAGYTPNKVLRFNINAGLNYTDMHSNELATSNSGFAGNLFGNIQITLPKDFRINLNGMYSSGRVSLQGEQSAFYFHNIALNKDFLKKKLTVSLACNSPFVKDVKFEMTTANDDFYTHMRQYMPMREVRLSLSYRFGSMKEAIRKVQRGISNDDVKAGGDSSSGATGSSTGGGM